MACSPGLGPPTRFGVLGGLHGSNNDWNQERRLSVQENDEFLLMVREQWSPKKTFGDTSRERLAFDRNPELTNRVGTGRKDSIMPSASAPALFGRPHSKPPASLCSAVRRGNPQAVVQFIAANGCDVNAEEWGPGGACTPLSVAVKAGALSTVLMLLEYGALPDKKLSGTEQTPLSLAEERLDHDVTHALKERQRKNHFVKSPGRYSSSFLLCKPWDN